jgi:DNA-directed RNA polymerase specialized sigma24 family protein
MVRANGRVIASSDAYATAADFEQIFTEDMSGLYLLSFLLTGDRDKAEECFVAGIGESTKGNKVFKEWARSWARRTIIKSAIRLVVPGQRSGGVPRNLDAARAMDSLPLALHAEVCAILELAPLERFVFVMSALERYSDHDCSILLGCVQRDITAARARALQHLGRWLNFEQNETDADLEDWPVRKDTRPVIEMTIAQYFATAGWNSSLSL